MRYIDYSTQGFDRLNMLEWPMHKRLEFVDDRELRVLADAGLHDLIGGNDLRAHLFEPIESEGSDRICAPPIDLSVLIESICLHPQASESFVRKAIEYCRAQGLPEPQTSHLAGIGEF